MEENIVSAQPEPYVSQQEYLRLERHAEYKSEYYDGEIFAMAGASRTHNRIVTNVVGELRRQLKHRPCGLYASDMRVKIAPTGLYAYPDIIVVCGREEFAEGEYLDTLLNPTVIFEALSKSTGGYDKGDKFTHYRELPSLKDYLLIATKEHRVEQYAVQAGVWTLRDVRGLNATVELPSIQCALPLREIYDTVEINVRHLSVVKE